MKIEGINITAKKQRVLKRQNKALKSVKEEFENGLYEVMNHPNKYFDLQKISNFN